MTSDIAMRIFDHYTEIRDIRSYYGLLTVFGLARVAEATDDEQMWVRSEAHVRRFPKSVAHPRYKFQNYRIGGLPQAYMIARGRMSDRRHLIVAAADETMRAPRTRAGLVKDPHTPAEDRLWIDAVYAVAPFLLYSGLATQRPEWVNESVKQTLGLIEVLRDDDTGLVHQAIGFLGPGKRSADHWSRGNGWALIGLAELIRALPDDHSDAPAVRKIFAEILSALLPYRSPRGLWRQEITRQDAFEESSGSALILYAIGAGLSAGILPRDQYLPVLAAGVNGLMETFVRPDGSILNSCESTLCPDDGSIEAYMARRAPVDEQHGAGPILMAMAAAHENGVAVAISTETVAAS